MTLDGFMIELQTKAKKCEFGDQKDHMIRERVIFGINDVILNTAPKNDQIVLSCRNK